MNIIDVTLRDGGHMVDFNWEIDFAIDYYNTLSNITSIDYIELGYWCQTSKSKNMFYNLDYDKVISVTKGKGLSNVSIMIDYHYCSKDLSMYPTSSQNEISMIRLCARKEDIGEALEFGSKLKEYSNINVSFNIFNSSNYTKEELDSISSKVANSKLDYIYFADTHGSMDLEEDISKFDTIVKEVKSVGKKVGFHLHDHNGKAYFNYRTIKDLGFDSSDTSIRGMGKGSGNLKLEHILKGDDLVTISSFIHRNPKLMEYLTNKIEDIPYELITSKYSLTDNYAKQGKLKGLNIEEFNKVCSSIKGLDKDTYNKNII